MYKIETPLLETCLFDLNGAVLGKHLSVELVPYIRPVAKLDWRAALKAQIAKDSDAARKVLGRI
jgi:FAD synthase